MTRRSRREEELREELESHLRMAAGDRIERGQLPGEATAAARRELGNISQIQEAARDVWGRRWIDTIAQDLRYALRMYGRNRSFALVAIVSLAPGIGANVALFEVVNAIRLRSLPVASPEALASVHITDMSAARGSRQTRYPSVTYPIWRELERRQQAFSDLFAWSATGFNLATGGEMRLAAGLWVTGSYFDALGLRPAVGRLLTRDDDREGCTPRAVLGHAFWQRTYGGQASIVGQTITLNNRPAEIVGVAPAGFAGLDVGSGFEVAVPVCAEAAFSADGRGRLGSGTAWWLVVFGRLKPDWNVDRAAAHLAAISPGLFDATVPANYPPESIASYKRFVFTATPGAAGVSEIRETYATPLWILLGTAGLVLLIACANLANLLLVRATARHREISVRLSLGASRARLVRQLITESLLLAAIGAAAGTILARWLSRALVGLLNTSSTAVTLAVGFDWRVAAFAAGLVLLTAAFFGVMPALRATRLTAATLMRGAGRGLTSGREAVGLRRLLVVAQLALSLVLLFGCLLFVRSLRNLSAVDPGFRSDGVVIARVSFDRLAVPPERQAAFRSELADRVRALPGIDAAAAVQFTPLGESSSANTVWMEGDPSTSDNALMNMVGPGYFATLGIPFVAGRDFDARDDSSSIPVAIVDETFARTILRGRPPIGARVVRQRTPARPEQAFTIVGVVRRSTYESLKESASPTMFLADRQSGPVTFVPLAVRSRLAAEAVTAEITSAMANIDPRITLRYTVLTSDIRNTLLLERLMAALSTGFGVLALVLTLAGLYGVIAYTVARRTNEIGVRMALGASRWRIARLVMRETGITLLSGLALGTGLALAAGRQASTLLFGVPPYDPWLLLGAAASLALVAIAASIGPASRATRIQPIIALRTE